MSLKIIFMGTPDFAVPALTTLQEKTDHEIIAVYSQPPRPSGRGHKVKPSPIHAYADSQNIPVYTPVSFKKEPEAVAEFQALNADIAVVAAYGLILPSSILEAPKHGCLNIHGSLLPRWRGAAPIQRAIWDGDIETGITIMQMERGLDTGPMILKGAMPITRETTAQSLHDDLADMGADLIVKTLDMLDKKGSLEAEAQDDSLSNYASMLSKEDGQINWQQPAVQIDRQIRALNPWPGNYSFTPEGRQIKILTAALSDQQTDKAPGTILDKKGHIACGNNTVLKLSLLKPENSKTMDFASALNGGHIETGSVFKH